MTETDNSPQLTKVSFCCPHCGAYTSQEWYTLHSSSLQSQKNKTPNIPTAERLKKTQEDPKISKKDKAYFNDYGLKMLTGMPFFSKESNDDYRYALHNCFISKCFSCNETSVWVHDKIVYPNKRIDILPNSDLPRTIQTLFNEARDIVQLSPKGAAALLRLCIQHLCKELGESGKNIDKDIANLVKKGLNPLVQQSLDIVRVIGNESVHPGEIDLSDNVDIAFKLFGLVNLISDQMISHPKQVQSLYDGLPSNKLQGIKDRDRDNN